MAADKMETAWAYLLQSSILFLVIANGTTSKTINGEGLINDRKNSTVEGDNFDVLFGKAWEEIKQRHRDKRAMAVKDKAGSHRWPGGVIHYAIDPNDFTPQDKQAILSAMQEYEKYTCVKFVNKYAPNMIKIKSSNGCHSQMGMVGGTQILSLAQNCRGVSQY